MSPLTIYSALNNGVSYKTLQSYNVGRTLVSKAAQLVNDLENINARKDISFSPVKTDTQKAQEKLDKLIAQSIKDITDIRKARGITTPAGQNKPLDELFKTIKGSVFNTSI